MRTSRGLLRGSRTILQTFGFCFLGLGPELETLTVRGGETIITSYTLA